jgi:stage IV sporulation protein B
VLFVVGVILGVQILRIPTELRVAPGQELKLSVGMPLRFYLPPSSPMGFTGTDGKNVVTAETGGICSTVMLKPLHEGMAEIELRLFGFPLRRLHVNILHMPLVYVGGQAIGVLVAEEGVVVVGHTPLRDSEGHEQYPAKEAGIRIGDLILAINGQPIHQIDQMEQIVQGQAKSHEELRLTIRRANQKLELKLKPVRQVNQNNQESYRMGVYVEDPAAGVGTMTFYLPNMGFGALGHRIVGFGQRQLSLHNGRIVQARITGIRPGAKGEPGEKIGIFASNDDIIGVIRDNTPFGIFGKLSIQPVYGVFKKPIQVALVSEVKTGPAEIYTVMSGEQIERFTVQIQKVFSQSHAGDKGMVIKVNDPELLRRAGGIIQGMSGSPIIQNGKLVGAVTHVFVNDPTQGYGIFAEWMLEAGGFLNNTDENQEEDSEEKAS